MSKGSSLLQLMVRRTRSAASSCWRLIGRCRPLHGPGQRSPATLIRSSLRNWQQLSANERASYDEVDYICERFGGSHGAPAPHWQSIFMQPSQATPILRAGRVSQGGGQGDMKAQSSAAQAAEPPQIQKRHKN